MREHHFANRALRHKLPQHHSQRLVVIVLAHENDALCLVARIDRRPVIVEARKRGLFDEHVLACRQRAQRQVKMKGGWHRDDHGVDLRIIDGRSVIREAPRTVEAAAVFLGPGALAARVACDDVGFEALQMAAMHLRDEPAAEKGQAKRLHWLEL